MVKKIFHDCFFNELIMSANDELNDLCIEVKFNTDDNVIYLDKNDIPELIAELQKCYLKLNNN